MDETDLHERLESRLMSHGVYVTAFEADDRTLRVEYETATPGGGVPHREIGRVLNLLLDAHQDEWDLRDVRATVYDIDDGDESGERGTWRADREWLDAHVKGELSEVELSQRVLSTIDER
ncbi:MULTISPECIES: hypothetical protein [Halorussus]|uniref:hypothetical protein n=1 Tax=Halorussus TaxID=1070314 RepID=UPI00209C6F6C|nr:hypothetical protein [Halorussus vallis]USZ75811.1 hypothetical protein NGM07_00465 [Halorussus vallis]